MSPQQIVYCNDQTRFGVYEYDHEVLFETYNAADNRLVPVMVSSDELHKLSDICDWMAYDNDDVWYWYEDDFGHELEMYSCDGEMEIEMLSSVISGYNMITLNSSQMRKIADLLNEVRK